MGFFKLIYLSNTKFTGGPQYVFWKYFTSLLFTSLHSTPLYFYLFQFSVMGRYVVELVTNLQLWVSSVSSKWWSSVT